MKAIRTKKLVMERQLFITAIAMIHLLVGLGQARSATYDLDLYAYNDSRWFDLWAQAFFELGSTWEVRDTQSGEVIEIQSPMRDGSFSLEEEGVVPAEIDLFDPFDFAPSTYYEVGTTSPGFGDVFINENDFSSSYSIAYNDSGITGVGVEVASVTGLSIDFDADVANDDTIFGVGYVSTASNVTGSVTLVDGEVGAINVTADVNFLYDTSTSTTANVGFLEYNGVLTFIGNTWGLAVDDNGNNALGSYRLAWDVHGEVADLAVVPEEAGSDFNNDMVINGADFLVWARNHGSMGVNQTQGDANEDTNVDSLDLAILQSQYGQVVSVLASTKVPEPMAFCLLVWSLPTLAHIRQRQSRLKLSTSRAT